MMFPTFLSGRLLSALLIVLVVQMIIGCNGNDEESCSTDVTCNTNVLHQIDEKYMSQLEQIDEFIRQENDSSQAIITCRQYMNLHTFVDPVSVTDTLYQEVSFSESTEKPDKCLTLDNTLQICNSYRPQYHEYFVHFPAAYLPKLQRALFVGGGDSMLLHELLKYPDLDLIVGLELDQAVVRQSLKHFYTQPHFDNPRVQWWFGDATKSLRLLPREWYGTFDLIMVDLSETVMSESVTEQIDILQALSLLLHPEDGILIKNERYMTKLNDIFEHVMQIYLPDVPIICDQDWVLASHGVDLLHPNFERLLGKYNPETLHYRPREDVSAHFSLIKDYSKNDIGCMIAEDDNITKFDENGYKNRPKHAIFMALEAEGAVHISQPDFILERALLNALLGKSELRIRKVATENIEGGKHIFILMQKGYITVTCWPEVHYCGADLVVWTDFDLIEEIKDAILKVIGLSKQPAAFRIVVGGVAGVDDAHETGPKLDSNGCKERPVCTEQCHLDEISRKNVSSIALSESLSLRPTNSDDIVVIFCGVPSESVCDTLTTVASRERSHPGKIIAVWECTGLGTRGLDDGIADTNMCDKSSKGDVFENVTSQYGTVDLVLIDPLVKSTSLIDIANAVTTKSFLSDNSIIILPNLSQFGQYFLEICRTKLRGDNLRMVLLSIHQDSEEREETMGYLSLGNAFFMQNATKLSERIASETGLSAHLVSMKSSPIARQSSYSPHHYTMSDYDEGPGMNQYSMQHPTGKQSLLQITVSNTTVITDGMIKASAAQYLSRIGRPILKVNPTAVGDGTIVHAVYEEGFVVFLWGGRDTIDANIYSYNQSIDHRKLFEDSFMKVFKGSSITQWDEHPRRAVNFSRDIRATAPGCVDRFVVCEKIAEFGECEVETERTWMNKNCAISCGTCNEAAIT